MKTTARTLALGLAIMLMQACALLGAPKPETFPERLAAGYVTVTANRQLNTTLLNAGILAARDGANVQQQNDTARAGLDVASTLGGTAAEDKLTMSLRILDEVKKYLEAKQVKK